MATETVTLEITATESITEIPIETTSPTPIIIPESTITPTETVTQVAQTEIYVSTPQETITTMPSGELVEILVKLEPGMQTRLEADIPEKYTLSTDPILESIDVAVIKVPENEKKEAISSLRSMPGVVFVEGEKIIHALVTVPNDPYVSQQYALTSIHAYDAWDHLPPSFEVPTIAIIDTGIDLNHPEFSGRILPGYDFYNEDSNPQDDNGHGTHVAGIAAGAGDNGNGIAGICWDADILPVKVLNRYGDGTYDLVARGIIWATDHGAEIINLSLGGSYQSQVLADAVDYALERGVLLVAASGNAGERGVYYPAAYPGVVAVGAVDQSNSHASFSNYGPELDLSAPGVSIISTNTGVGYSYRSGTSMSAPMVTGSIALLSEIQGYSPYSALYILEDTAQDLGTAGLDSTFGYGLIRLDRAVNWSPVTPTSVPQPENQPGQNGNSGAGYFPSIVASLTPTSPAQATFSSTITNTPEIIALSVDTSAESSITPTRFMTLTLSPPLQNASPDLAQKVSYPWLGWLLILLGIILLGIKKIWLGRYPDLK